jgi:hypothetical protein
VLALVAPGSTHLGRTALLATATALPAPILTGTTVNPVKVAITYNLNHQIALLTVLMVITQVVMFATFAMHIVKPVMDLATPDVIYVNQALI